MLSNPQFATPASSAHEAQFLLPPRKTHDVFTLVLVVNTCLSLAYMLIPGLWLGKLQHCNRMCSLQGLLLLFSWGFANGSQWLLPLSQKKWHHISGLQSCLRQSCLSYLLKGTQSCFRTGKTVRTWRQIFKRLISWCLFSAQALCSGRGNSPMQPPSPYHP